VLKILQLYIFIKYWCHILERKGRHTRQSKNIIKNGVTRKMQRFWHVHIIIILKNQIKLPKCYSFNKLVGNMEIKHHIKVSSFQMFVLNTFNELHGETSDFPETCFLPHNASCNQRCLAHLCDLTLPVALWVGQDMWGLLPSLHRGESWSSEVGMLKSECAFSRCHFRSPVKGKYISNFDLTYIFL